MKIKQIQENTYSTVTSVGNIEYTTSPRRISLKKRRRDDETKTETIGTIEREKNKGWKFKPTDSWNQHNLPHMGHIINKRVKNRGEKTIEKHIEDTLKELNISYDSIEKEPEDDQ